MPGRFRQTFTLIPGVKINLSKGMPSVSLGRDGASLNISEDGVKGTVGLPGTGLSWSKDHLER